MTRTRHVDLATARRAVTAIRAEIASHRKVCRDCWTPYDRAARYCDTGYDLAVLLAGTEADIRRLSAPDLGPPPALFQL